MTPLLTIDAALRDVLVRWHTPWLDWVMWTLTTIGVGGSVWLCIALLMAVWRPHLRAAAWQIVLAALLTLVLVDVVTKPLVARPRPFVTIATARVVGYKTPTYSFPSGHAAVSFAAATVLAHASRRRRGVWFGLAALIAISRVYVGVHYPLDIIAGTALGLAIGVIVTGGRAWYSGGSSAAPHSVPR